MFLSLVQSTDAALEYLLWTDSYTFRYITEYVGFPCIMFLFCSLLEVMQARTSSNG